MSFKALPVKVQQSKNRQGGHNTPGTVRVKILAWTSQQIFFTFICLDFQSTYLSFIIKFIQKTFFISLYGYWNLQNFSLTQQFNKRQLMKTNWVSGFFDRFWDRVSNVNFVSLFPKTCHHFWMVKNYCCWRTPPLSPDFIYISLLCYFIFAMLFILGCYFFLFFFKKQKIID